MAIALADGISSSDVSQAAVAGLLEDYYCTSNAWSVKTSVEWVLAATNSWLRAQTQDSQYRYDKAPAGNAASGSQAGQHHDRCQRHREDHRFRLGQGGRRAPLIERNPLAFWKGLSFLLMAALVVLLALHHSGFSTR